VTTLTDVTTDVADHAIGDETLPQPESQGNQGDSPIADASAQRRIRWRRVAAHTVLPGLALVLAVTAGTAKWAGAAAGDDAAARGEAVEVAKTSTIALLSYKPDTVGQDLDRARDLLTGSFRDSYTSLIHDVVIPGARREKVSTVAAVPAAAAVRASPNHAVVLVFVDQTVTVGSGAPTGSASTVRVTLDKVGNRWLISQFEPI